MSNATIPAVRVQRTFDASPERVFDAWLDAGALAQFMRPGPTMTCDVVNDPKVGGRFFITMMGEGDVTQSYRFSCSGPKVTPRNFSQA
jgi:uncharacterized protein YndB with AHSA1/START domain